VSIDAKDALLADAAAAQRARGRLPTPADNERYLRGVLERLDRKEAEARPAPASRPEKRPGALAAEARRRAARAGFALEGSFELTRTPLAAGGPILEVGKVESAMRKKLRARLRLLRSKPDWKVRIQRINPLALQGAFGKEKQKLAQLEVMKVINDSNRIFGHWMKPPPPAPAYSLPTLAK
jgi:hypothetical protein